MRRHPPVNINSPHSNCPLEVAAKALFAEAQGWSQLTDETRQAYRDVAERERQGEGQPLT